MANIVFVENAFEPLKTRVVQHRGGIPILTFLREQQPGFREFKRPTICTVNGDPVMRESWPKFIIGEQDTVSFINVQGDLVTLAYYLVAAIVVAAVAVALTPSIGKPALPGQIPEPDPVYDLKGQRNQVRLGSPIEVAYGRNRLWPSYAARPYNQYINNDQYQYQLFCLGQGVFADIDAYIEDTQLNNFPDVEWAIYLPGEPVTLFPDNVITSVEVNGIEMYGSNETGYGGLSGPFTLNAAATLANRLEIDLVLPLGLFFAGSTGQLQFRTITASFEKRLIDDLGAPLGSWEPFVEFSQTLATNTPQRFTLGEDVTPGRYEVRGVRTNLKDTDSNSGNTLRWDSARAFLPPTVDYGDVTLYALKVRATNNLNDRSSNRFNVRATRVLPIWDKDTQTWLEPQATRSIAWAFLDLWRSAYGGRLDDQFLDLDAVADLDVIWTGLGYTFDFVFEQRMGVWEAAKIIARAGRAVPMLNISQITMIREYEKTLPTAVYNRSNIVKDSFAWDIRLAEFDEYDGVEVEYVDPVTFLPETVKCLIGDDAGDNCEKIKFPGITNRDQAYREGLYIRAQRLKQRENITFRTGLEGRIPKYGDLIKVEHDLPKWATGGIVLSIVGDTITTSEPLDFSAPTTHVITLRKKDGTPTLPLEVIQGGEANEAILTNPGDVDVGDYYFDDIHGKPLFVFGPDNNDAVLCTVVNMAPGDDDTVEIKAVVYDSSIFDGDGDDSTPPPIRPRPPRPPDVPELDCDKVTATFNPLDPTKILVQWVAALGAIEYRLEKAPASDGPWLEVTVTSALSHEIITTDGEQIFLRVQPVGNGAGEWCYPNILPRRPNDYTTKFPPISAPFTISCKSREGEAVLCGFDEFTASIPPRKYKARAVSGGMAIGQFEAADYTQNGISFEDDVELPLAPLISPNKLRVKEFTISAYGPGGDPTNYADTEFTYAGGPGNVGAFSNGIGSLTLPAIAGIIYDLSLLTVKTPALPPGWGGSPYYNMGITGNTACNALYPGQGGAVYNDYITDSPFKFAGSFNLVQTAVAGGLAYYTATLVSSSSEDTGSDWEDASHVRLDYPGGGHIYGVGSSVNFTVPVGDVFTVGISWNYIYWHGFTETYQAGVLEWTDAWNILETWEPIACVKTVANHATIRTYLADGVIEDPLVPTNGNTAAVTDGRPDLVYLPKFSGFMIQEEPEYAQTVQTSPVRRTTIGVGCIDGVGFGPNSMQAQGVVDEVLSLEDTEDDAIIRLGLALDVSDPWDDMDWTPEVDCSPLVDGCDDLDACESRREARTSGFTFDVKQGRALVEVTELPAQVTVIMLVTYWKEDLTDPTIKAPYSEESFEQVTDVDGAASFEIDLPYASGQRVYIKQIQFFAPEEGEELVDYNY